MKLFYLSQFKGLDFIDWVCRNAVHCSKGIGLVLYSQVWICCAKNWDKLFGL